MKYQGVSDSDVEVNLKSSLFDMKQIVNFISKHLPEDPDETIGFDYNFYSIQRIKRELEDAKNRVKEELNNL